MGKSKNQSNESNESTQSTNRNSSVSKASVASRWQKLAQKGIMLKRVKEARTADELSLLFEPAVAINDESTNQMDVEQSASSSVMPN